MANFYKIVLILTLVASCIAQSSNHYEVKLSDNLTSEQCLAEMRELLQPQRVTNLLHTYLYSGKGLNQLGNFDECNLDDYLEYVLIKAMSGKYTLVSIGICAPKACSQNGNYQNIANSLASVVNELSPGSNAEAKVDVPNELNKEELDVGATIVSSLLALILIFWVLGIIVQYTKLCDIKNSSSQNDQPIPIQDKKTRLGLFFYSWSPIVNISELFTVKEGGDQRLSVLNGVRVLSICYVILVHVDLLIGFVPIANFTTTNNVTKEPLYGIIQGGYYGVDTFFFLSGFLSCFISTLKMYPNQGRVNVLKVYFHRYYRLIWGVLFIILITIYLMNYLGDGPIYKESSKFFTNVCKDTWWQNLIFINNWYPWSMQDQCNSYMWYLACDFQLSLMMPLVVYIYCKARKLGYSLAFFLVFVCIMINGGVTIAYDIEPNNEHHHDDGPGTFLYERTFPRMGAYFIGAIFGLSYFELQGKDKYPELQRSVANRIYAKLKDSKTLSLITFMVGFGLTAVYVFSLSFLYNKCGADGTIKTCWPKVINVLYNATSRTFFALGVGLVIAPTFVGRLRVIRGFLGSEFFTFAARLNYMVYLIHVLVIAWIISDTRQAVYINWLNTWYLMMGITVMSFIFAVPATLMFEVPFLKIEKYVLFPKARKQIENSESNIPSKGAHFEPLAISSEESMEISKSNGKNFSIQ